MAKSKNPFYTLLVIIGTLFVVTACAYFVMALRGADPGGQAAKGNLVEFMEDHGLTLIIVELLALAFATFAAMGTDEYWDRRAKEKEQRHADDPE